MSSWVCIIPVRALHRVGGLYISGVDFGCFSTFNGDCEALVEREEWTDFTLFRCIYVYMHYMNKRVRVTVWLVRDKAGNR